MSPELPWEDTYHLHLQDRSSLGSRAQESWLGSVLTEKTSIQGLLWMDHVSCTLRCRQGKTAWSRNLPGHMKTGSAGIWGREEGKEVWSIFISALSFRKLLSLERKCDLNTIFLQNFTRPILHSKEELGEQSAELPGPAISLEHSSAVPLVHPVACAPCRTPCCPAPLLGSSPPSCGWVVSKHNCNHYNELRGEKNMRNTKHT